ncbi:hypothetical protein D3C83_148080 [compost metagenome]
MDIEPASNDEPTEAQPHQQLAEVTDLAARVSAAASNASADSLSARIANAQSPQEVEQIMAEAGAVQSLV